LFDAGFAGAESNYSKKTKARKKPPVIASVAKQSRNLATEATWIASLRSQ
jgi:hypothetical protein